MQLLARQDNIAEEGRCKETSTNFLYSNALGKMFGVLVCEDQHGKRHTLKAFSGQYNGLWQVEGWVPPLFSVHDFWQILTPVEKEIKALGEEMQLLPPGSAKQESVRRQRKQLSQELMRRLHALYTLHNFKQQSCKLTELFPKNHGIPTGTGDCCAPKLLNHAARKQYTPLGIVEFYWGKTNRSSTRQEGNFYPPCSDKCGPILGFLLCGIETYYP